MDFQFDISKTINKARRIAQKHVGGVTLNLPFVSFNVDPDDVEKAVARELLIRLPDKRVLNAKECCDNCIDNSLASLQEIRSSLVDAQVKLADHHDGGLYLLIELMAEGIRQFLTYEETLHVDPKLKNDAARPDFYRPSDIQQQYFQVLEQLRFHIHSCLSQVATIAEMETPKIESYLKSDDTWMLSCYRAPDTLLEKS